MKKNSILAVMAVLLLTFGCMPVWSQAVGARVNGTLTDNGKPAPGLQVVITNEDNGRTYKTKTDKNGKFDMVGLTIGYKYKVEVFSPTGESLFHRNNVAITGEGGVPDQMAIDVSNQANTNMGMTNEGTVGGKKSGGETGQPKYTKEQIEAIRAQNAKATNMNTLITQAMNAMNAKNWQEAIPPLQQLVQADPTRYEFYQSLGDAQLSLGQNEEAIQSYSKGVEAAEANTTVDPKNSSTDPAKKKVHVAQMLTNEGNAYLKLHKNTEAVAAFTKAASMDPNPGVAYFNLCATQYNAGNSEGALAACDKAIQADPNKADAYFIKGSLLIGESKQDKEGKFVAPPGTSEALNKYLELSPDGAHANDVKQMLAMIGAKIETTYKERKKK